MKRLTQLMVTAFLIVATMGVIAGCSEDGGTGASLVTTSAASGGDSSSDSTEATTTETVPPAPGSAPIGEYDDPTDGGTDA